MKIAINTICKDEIKYIDRFFEKHLAADYICILDTGSTDGTWEKLQEYSQKYPEKVIIKQTIFPFFRFDTARNEALLLVPQDADFFFKVDIDEYLEEGWYQTFQQEYDSCSLEVSLRYVEYDSSLKVKDEFHIIGLKNDGGWYWKYAVHEDPYRLDAAPAPSQRIAAITVFHTPKWSTLENSEENLKKVKFYNSLVDVRYREDPNDFNNLLYKSYALFQDDIDSAELRDIVTKLYAEHFNEVCKLPYYVFSLFMMTLFCLNDLTVYERSFLKYFLKDLCIENPSQKELNRIHATFLYFRGYRFIEALEAYYYEKDLSVALNFLSKKENEDYHNIRYFLERINNYLSEHFEEPSESFKEEKKKLYKGAKDLANKLFTIFRSLETISPLQNLGIEVLLVNHCNLNCAYCNHFAPLADPGYYSVQDYDKDLQNLFELFSDQIFDIKLMGGEPLLHPEIEEFCKLSKQYFPKANVSVLTNGLKLLEMPESFFDICREQNIKISITPYSILPLDQIIAFLQSRSIVYDLYPDSVNDREKKIMERFCINPQGNTDVKAKFLDCGNANKTLTLRDGYLYTCPFKATVQYFVKKFNYTQLPIDPKLNGVELAKTTKWEALKFLCNPTPLCSYCHGECELVTWKKSERVPEEWLLSESSQPRYISNSILKELS